MGGSSRKRNASVVTFPTAHFSSDSVNMTQEWSRSLVTRKN